MINLPHSFEIFPKCLIKSIENISNRIFRKFHVLNHLEPKYCNFVRDDIFNTRSHSNFERTLIISNGSGNGTGNRETEADHLIVKKPPPRSLTEDDLEHISRLPSQEIVLVYFPDTTR